MTFQAQADTTYYIMVASTSASGGQLVFSLDEIPAPTNDDFDSATVIYALPFTETALDTRGATVAGDDPNVTCGGRQATVWYQFTPDHDMRLEARRTGSDYNAGIAIFTGSRGALNSVACRSGYDSTPLKLDVVVNTAYFIMVFADFGGGGISNKDIISQNDASVILKDSTISANTASRAGGLLNAGTLILNNSTVSKNTSSSEGGGGIDNRYVR